MAADHCRPSPLWDFASAVPSAGSTPAHWKLPQEARADFISIIAYLTLALLIFIDSMVGEPNSSLVPPPQPLPLGSPP